MAVFLSGGRIAVAALDALAPAYEVVAIVRLGPRRRLAGRLKSRASRFARRLRLAPPDPIVGWASEARIPIITASRGDDRDAAKRLSALRPDYGCIATFPTRIGPTLLEASGDVCVNLHPSLLPRHRGADPLFWTYHAGDLKGGVTVHVATSELDSGPILGRTACEIGRAEPVTAVHARYAAAGGPLLVRAIASLGDGSAELEPQDESAATAAPRVKRGTVHSRLTEWSAEQAWHFLAGMVERYRDPYTDERGRSVRYGRVPGFETRPPRHAPGSVVRDGAGWSAWATDGVVHLAPGPTRMARLRRRF